MTTIIDHVLLWGGFFLAGLALGLLITFILIQASKVRF